MVTRQNIDFRYGHSSLLVLLNLVYTCQANILRINLVTPPHTRRRRKQNDESNWTIRSGSLRRAVIPITTPCSSLSGFYSPWLCSSNDKPNVAYASRPAPNSRQAKLENVASKIHQTLKRLSFPGRLVFHCPLPGFPPRVTVLLFLPLRGNFITFTRFGFHNMVLALYRVYSAVPLHLVLLGEGEHSCSRACIL